MATRSFTFERIPVMWTINPDDISRAKEELKGRRAAVEARYAADLKTLDADLAEIETLEQVAVAFAAKHLPDPTPTEPMQDMTAQSDTRSATPIDSLAIGNEAKGSSRWRLRLGEPIAPAEPV
jgi:hypothetical protein